MKMGIAALNPSYLATIRKFPMYWAISALIFAIAPLLIGMASGHIAEIHGTVLVKGGQPAVNAELIVLDSWAGLFTMRERELLRIHTNANGKFHIRSVRFTHAINIRVMEKPCAWHTGTIALTEGTRNPDGSYELRIEVMPVRRACDEGA